MNAGKPDGQLSACFVLPVEDSMEEIFDSIKNAALIHKTGGGTGFSFSRIRPAGSVVKTTGGVASGPISFMRTFDAATESVKQGGCFVGETKVLTKTGPVQIKDLHDGMEVLTTLGYYPCTDPFMTKENTEVWSLSVKDFNENEFTVVATPDHPILTGITADGYEYTRIDELRIEDHVIISCDYEGEIDYAEVIAIVPQVAKRDVWNVEVPEVHNYFVCDSFERGIFVSNTRRGANMGILRVDHPDILDFINCKNDTHVMNNFNISVAITDKFMQAVKNEHDYELRDPHTGEVTGTLYAPDVFNMIVESAWKTGEPGIFFIDRCNEHNTLKSVYGEIESTNPCVVGDTKILTSDGEVEIASVEDTPVYVWNGEQFSFTIPTCTGTNVETMHVGVVDEYGTTRKIECTLYHKFILRDGTIVQAQELSSGMELLPYRVPSKYHYDESIGSIIIEEYLEINDPKVKYIRNGKVVEKVYCFNESSRHRGIFNGIMTGNCGEQPLLPYEACNLGSINLLNCIEYVNDAPKFNYDKLRDITRLATRFLDDVIEVNHYPLPEIDKVTRETRKIGLGVMGFADVLFSLGIPYGSEGAIALAREIMSTINDTSHDTSMDLARIRGPYPAFYELFKTNKDIPYMRNNVTTTIAPTGTLSIIADVSSGIEPAFALGYYRNVMDGTKLPYINKILEKKLSSIFEKESCDYLIDFIISKNHGTFKGLMENPELDKTKIVVTEKYAKKLDISLRDATALVAEILFNMSKVYICAHDITPEQHIRTQAEFQKYTDNAISKTINFNHDATKEDVRTAYMLAYDLGCKGTTIYRDGKISSCRG